MTDSLTFTSAMLDAEELGCYIREQREKAGLTQAELAVAVGKSRPTITQLERGTIKYPKIYMLSAVAQALDISPVELFAVAGVNSPETLSYQLQWLASQLDNEGNELLVEIGHALLRERQRQQQKARRPAARR